MGPICEVCKLGIENGIALYRTGGKGKGIDPHWRCSVDKEKVILDPVIEEIITIIENSNKGK